MDLGYSSDLSRLHISQYKLFFQRNYIIHYIIYAAWFFREISFHDYSFINVHIVIQPITSTWWFSTWDILKVIITRRLWLWPISVLIIQNVFSHDALGWMKYVSYHYEVIQARGFLASIMIIQKVTCTSNFHFQH